MFKTIITFAALATLTAAAIAPAHAGWSNGGGANGWSNGGNTNGWTNGGGLNGGGNNGGSSNGAASSSSTLTVLAIELPPEIR